MIVLALSLALAATPDWVKEIDGQTEICAVPVDGDPEVAEPPPITPLQALRRDATSLEGPLVPPVLRTLSPDPVAISVEAAEHPLRPGWSLVRVEAAVAPVKTAVEQHITVAVDTSDSMSSASFRGLPLLLDEPPPELGSYRGVGRLDLTKEVLHSLVDSLDGEETTFALVVFYRGNAATLLDPTPVADKKAMHTAIDQISSERVQRTDLMSVLYRTAAKAFTACADDRVLLFTDDNPQIQGKPADVQSGIRTWATQGLRLHAFAVGTIADLTPIARLTAAGGGELQRIDTVAEAREALVMALRPTGSPVSDPKVEVRFPRAWRHLGADGVGSVDAWVLPEPMTSDWTRVEVYEVEGGVGTEAVFSASSAIPGEWSKTWTGRVSSGPGPLAEAPFGLRHDGAYALAQMVIRDADQRAVAQKALAQAVREVGPGREAQALIERSP